MGNRRQRGKGQPIAIKVYLVHQRINIAPQDQPNSRVIAARLTNAAAQVVVDREPGTWIEKVVAVK